MRRSRRVPVRDWMSYRGGRSVVHVFGPLDISVAQLEAGLVARSKMAPDYFALQTFDVSKQRLSFPFRGLYPDVARRLLRVDPRPMDDPNCWAAELAEDASPEELVLWKYRDGYVAFVFSHMIADGRSATRSAMEVIALAQGHDVEISTGRRHRLPIARAAVKTYSRKPGAFVDVIKGVLPGTSRSDDSSASDGPSREERGASEATISTNDIAIAHCMLDSRQTARLATWRATQTPQVRLAASVISGFCGALIAEGFTLSPLAPYVVWDIRRYAGIQELDPTNLLGGVMLSVADPTDPQLVGDAIHQATLNAEPLGGTVSEAVFGWRDRRSDFGKQGPQARTRELSSLPTEPMPALSVLTDPMMEQLPWAAPPDERTYITFINTCEPAAVPLLIEQIDGVIHMTAVCHAKVFDPCRVQAALQRFANDPLELIAK
ncbi:MAG: hypothetical protein WC054_07185 [Candidatus Nanopelagicales bacterium]